MSSYLLKLRIVDESVRPLYEEKIKYMKSQEYQKKTHKDAGFDIYLPHGTAYHPAHSHCLLSVDYLFKPRETRLIDMGIQCAVYYKFAGGKSIPAFWPPHSFYIYPRSSISKTPLRLANNVGIIDSGYRGNIMGAFDNISNSAYTLKAGTRLLQICMPNLCEFDVEIVSSLDETERGAGGFGSTGK